ncbi:MAG TPA: efflux RND transporter periplasmic adaptor subunit [Vicinamibacterales bacterium]|nr:efflux RND transporter periplasmic adaptor subunit [Vicinamibacterales bacterium]
MKRTTLASAGLIVAATVGFGAYYSMRAEPAPALTTAAVTRGDIVNVVSATGTLQAVTTVQVGSQISGTVESLHADYNSMVRKGQLLARLDSSTYATALEQAQAALQSAEAEVERLRVARAAADAALVRARELTARQLLPAADLQTAETDSRTAAAQLVGAEARVAQARSGVRTAQVNLSKTVITSPIDGVVIARNVDVGQTVAASLSAPTLFIIAADLTQMQLNASIDESDLGQVAAGQTVTFTVDAYPSDRFSGTVSQVRLNATSVNNVVTYAAIVDAPNPALKLKPGMTATLTVEIARREGVLRVPAAALRFKPSAEVLARLESTPAQQPPKGPTLWIPSGKGIAPLPVKTGAADATYTEVIGSSLVEGATVVTRAAVPGDAAAAARPSSPNAGNPLLPAGRPR